MARRFGFFNESRVPCLLPHVYNIIWFPLFVVARGHNEAGLAKLRLSFWHRHSWHRLRDPVSADAFRIVVDVFLAFMAISRIRHTATWKATRSYKPIATIARPAFAWTMSAATSALTFRSSWHFHFRQRHLRITRIKGAMLHTQLHVVHLDDVEVIHLCYRLSHRATVIFSSPWQAWPECP